MQLFDRRVLDVSITIQGIANEPAENPAVGTQYIVGETPTGAFASATANKIARFDGTKWRFTKPKAGRLEVINLETNEILKFNGTEWTAIANIGGDNGIKSVIAIVHSSNDPEYDCYTLLDEDIGGVFIYTTTANNYNFARLNGLTYDGSVDMDSADGDAYLSSDDGKLYVYSSEESNYIATEPSDGELFYVEREKAIYSYKASTHSLVRISVSSQVKSVTDLVDYQTQNKNQVPTGKSYIATGNSTSHVSIKDGDTLYAVNYDSYEGDQDPLPIEMTEGMSFACASNGKVYVFTFVEPYYFYISYSLADGEVILNQADGFLYRYNASTHTFVKVSVSVSEGGAESIAPVIAIVPTGTTLPSTASISDKFLKIDDAKIYTATAADTWDSGVLTADGDRYVSSTDFKIYASDGSEVTGEAIPTGGMFLNKADNYIYVYDTTLIRASVDNAKIVETHTLTAAEATAKSFTLNNSIKTGEETNIMLFVGGAPQVPGTDFTALGNAISWNEKGLDDIGLVEDDVFIIHYVKG